MINLATIICILYSFGAYTHAFVGSQYWADKKVGFLPVFILTLIWPIGFIIMIGFIINDLWNIKLIKGKFSTKGVVYKLRKKKFSDKYYVTAQEYYYRPEDYLVILKPTTKEKAVAYFIAKKI